VKGGYHDYGMGFPLVNTRDTNRAKKRRKRKEEEEGRHLHATASREVARRRRAVPA